MKHDGDNVVLGPLSAPGGISLAVSTTSATSAAIAHYGKCDFLSDVAVDIKLGDAPGTIAAGAPNYPLVAGLPYRFWVTPTTKVSAITASGSGTLRINPVV